MIEISIVTPILNEEETISIFLEKLKKTLEEIDISSRSVQ